MYCTCCQLIVSVTLPQFAGQLQNPTNFNFTVVDPASDSAPVSVTFTWDRLVGDMGEISYTINITDNGTLINSTTVNSTNMTTVENLPPCLSLEATLVATNTTDMSESDEECLQFNTTENGDYVSRASLYMHVNVSTHVHAHMYMYTCYFNHVIKRLLFSYSHAECDIRGQRDLCFFSS